MNSIIIGGHYGIHSLVKGAGGEQGGMASMNGVGIEVEMENVIDTPTIKGWFSVTDASLRNN